MAQHNEGILWMPTPKRNHHTWFARTNNLLCNSQSILTWKMKYTKGLQKTKPTEPLPIEVLQDQKQRQPLLLGDQLDTGVQAYVEKIRKLGGIANTAIVQGGTQATIADRDRTILDTLASSWKRLGKVAFVQDGLCGKEGCSKGKSCDRGI